MKFSRKTGQVLAAQAGHWSAKAGMVARLPRDLSRTTPRWRQTMNPPPSDQVQFTRPVRPPAVLAALVFSKGEDGVTNLSPTLNWNNKTKETYAQEIR
jgi:hypothetical protein